jgi:hypothetical protein
MVEMRRFRVPFFVIFGSESSPEPVAWSMRNIGKFRQDAYYQ